MGNKSVFKAFVMTAISCMVGAAHADVGLKVTAETVADEQGVVISMVVYEEVEEINMVGNKITRQVDAGSVIPGDRLLYITTVKNRSQQLAENVAIVNPIPEHTTYLAASAQGNGSIVTFSVDGGKGFDTAANLTITDENGASHPALTTDYTHIRWVISSLPSKAEEEMIFRARLD